MIKSPILAIENSRANQWAEKQGFKPVSEASLLEWRKEGLVPPPSPHGLGRGMGKAEDWSWLAYRRVLKIIRMRSRGIIHRRDQRLILWFEGNHLSLDLIREDLERTWEANIKRVSLVHSTQ